MSTRNPLSSQCTATSKRTGNRCQQWVVGGGVCYRHGGAARQVRARREARLAALEAQQRDEPIEVRDPGDALVAAAVTADELAQRLRRELNGRESLSPATLMALGDWLDRVGRLSKAVLDARVDERRVRLAEGQGQLLVGVIRAVLDRLQLTAGQRALVPVVVPEELRRVAELEPGGPR